MAIVCWWKQQALELYDKLNGEEQDRTDDFIPPPALLTPAGCD